jgi:hypothetical protein
MSRKQIEAYMIDCHAFDQDQLNEWETKADMIADIKSFGWYDDLLEYIN